MVLYEMVTLGAAPYPSIDALDVLAYLLSEKRMERPDGCDDAL